MPAQMTLLYTASAKLNITRPHVVDIIESCGRLDNVPLPGRYSATRAASVTLLLLASTEQPCITRDFSAQESRRGRILGCASPTCRQSSVIHLGRRWKTDVYRIRR